MIEEEYQLIKFFKEEIKYYRNLSELNLSYLEKGLKIETDDNKLGKIELKKEDMQRSFTSSLHLPIELIPPLTLPDWRIPR